MPTVSIKRRTASSFGDVELLEHNQALRKMTEQSNQRQASLRIYSETTRKEMKSTGRGLLLKLFILPLGVVVIGMFLLAMKMAGNPDQIMHINELHDGAPINKHLSSFAQEKIIEYHEEEPLPKWITDYVQWHQETRAKFPGEELFTNKDAPKLLVRTCLGICGGLHDRLGQLPWDIYLAMRLKRVLLIAWQRPRALENFLIPPQASDEEPLAIDWRVDPIAKFGFEDFHRVIDEVKQLFDSSADQHPGEGDFWTKGFEKAMVRAGAPPSPGVKESYEEEEEYIESKYLRHRLLGHLDEKLLEERLEREGYYKDEKHWKASDLHKTPTFERIWKLFFRPSPEVRSEIVNAMREMDLLLTENGDTNSPNDLPPTVSYKAVHCRVRHPKAHPIGPTAVLGKSGSHPADKTGLPWVEGEPLRAFAIETANTALICAREIRGNVDETAPVYFLSDSNDLVTHVAVELADDNYLKEHGSNSSWVNPALLETLRSQKVVARNTTIENAHIDKQKGRPPHAYYGTFVDLYLAMKATCVVYGIGYYAAFAAKISGTDCAYQYTKEVWGAQKEKNGHVCPNT